MEEIKKKETEEKCEVCEEVFNTQRGLKTHITRSHTSFSGCGTDENKNYST